MSWATRFRAPYVAPRLMAVLVAVLVGANARAAEITVTTATDADVADASCSLREAITAANDNLAYHGCAAGQGADRIVFALTTPATISLTASLPALTGPTLIRGPGRELLTIDGQDAWQIIQSITPTPDRWIGIEHLTLTRGLATAGGAVLVESGTSIDLRGVRVAANSASGGGGAYFAGSSLDPVRVLIADCEIAGNTSTGASGAAGVRFNGPNMTATVRATTISGNSVTHVNGGGAGLYVFDAAVTLDHVTVSGNSSARHGGGILVTSSSIDSTLTVSDSTIAANVVDADSTGTGDGGGLYVTGSVGRGVDLVFRNSILAANVDSAVTSYPDVYLNPSVQITIDWQSQGRNLVGSNANVTSWIPDGSPNVDGDFVGTAASAIDPRLATLADNGGLTQSHLPLLEPGSPVIDKGACPDAERDQRFGAGGGGAGRVFDEPTVADHAQSDGCDIGSVESGVAGDASVPLFEDGFESGTTLRWDDLS